MNSASYSVVRLPWLIKPLLKFPVGMYPFGHEWDHLTEQQIEEYREW